MKILYAKCFGLGNAVMALPAIHRLVEVGHDVTVLIGSTNDDRGAFEVFLRFAPSLGIAIKVDRALDELYDVAILAIPFDGRWKEDVHFRAKQVIDGRPRPDFSPELGFLAWKKHEVEYQLDDLVELGISVDGSSRTGLWPISTPAIADRIYLGLGFKRDAATFWSKKHWGNKRFIEFITHCKKLRPSIQFVTTGNLLDMQQVIVPIADLADIKVDGDYGLPHAFSVLESCQGYFGNDTGMMHVSAMMDKPTYGLMAFENVATKNAPLCSMTRYHDFSSGKSDPKRVAEDFVKFMWEDA